MMRGRHSNPYTWTLGLLALDVVLLVRVLYLLRGV